CAIRNDGSLWCWGWNRCGQIGNGEDGTCGDDLDATAVMRPTRVCAEGAGASCVPLGPVAHVSAGFDHTCAVVASGEVVCWGDNFDGQLGDGTVNNRTAPTFVCESGDGDDCTRLGNVAQVFAGDTHSCALTTQGEAFCWGNNSCGALGNGDSVDCVALVTE